MSRLLVVVALVAVLASGCGGGGSAAPTDPLAARLQHRLEGWSARGGVPSATVVIRRSGEELWSGTTGTSPDVQMRVASITKLFTAAVVLQLVEEGAVGLGDPVGPRLGPRFEGVTVRQLLNHTSGMPDYGAPTFTDRLVAEPERRWTDEEVLETLSGVRRAFPPGEAREYSNTNYVALAALVTEMVRRPWHRELRRRILEPLKLDDTYVAGVEEPRGRGLVADAWFDIDNDGDHDDVEDGSWPALETSESAAGAIVSTAADVAAFAEALFTGRVVDSASVRAMVAGGPFPRRYEDYGLGVELRRPDLRTPVWGHGGFLPGYRSVVWYVPSTATTVAVLANHSQANPSDLASLLLAEID